MSGIFSWFHRYLNFSFLTTFSQYMGMCRQEHCVHVASLCVWVNLCNHRGLACPPDSIDTLIFLIWPNWAKMWVCSHKKKACMHASLFSWVLFCTQIALTGCLDSIDTSNSQIWPDLAKIWAQACQKIMCIHTCMLTQFWNLRALAGLKVKLGWTWSQHGPKMALTRSNKVDTP